MACSVLLSVERWGGWAGGLGCGDAGALTTKNNQRARLSGLSAREKHLRPYDGTSPCNQEWTLADNGVVHPLCSQNIPSSAALDLGRVSMNVPHKETISRQQQQQQQQIWQASG